MVFIRQYEHTTNRGNRSKTMSSFEFSTVPYPLPIKKIFVTKNLDFWRSGRFRRGGKLTSDKTHNLNGQPMRTVVLEHTPAVSVTIDSWNETLYSGLEIEVIIRFWIFKGILPLSFAIPFHSQILRAISQSMNFTAAFYESDDEKRGTSSPNGSFMANIEEIVSRNSGQIFKNSVNLFTFR